MKSARFSRLYGLALTLMVAGTAWGDSLPELGEASAVDVPPALERQIGEAQMNDIRQREPTYLDDAELGDYLNRLAARLLAAGNVREVEVRLFAIDNPTINAFAMFGGFIGINTGLVLAAQQESEVAGVLAHEIAHVTQRHLARQIAQQKQVALGSMVGIALAILAARSNADVANAALATSQAAGIQAQLGFSRDHEREADRIGFEMLQRAGFDPQGMVSFFQRLQRAGRVYENNAPVYLRTHPLTFERITDMEHRAAQLAPGPPAGGDAEFRLLQAKLAASRGTPDEAVREFARRAAEDPASPVVAYGQAVALMRDRQWEAARRAVQRADPDSPVVSRLSAEIAAAAGDRQIAERLYRQALARHPDRVAIFYGLADHLLNTGGFAAARTLLEGRLRTVRDDAELHARLARAYDGLGLVASRHRAQAEAYQLRGQTHAAIEQLELAQRAGTQDFVEQSIIDARLRELKRRQAELTPAKTQ